MCGICAYIGCNESYEHLMNGLKMLQNRGYDSAGLCMLDINRTFKLKKYASILNINAVEKLGDDSEYLTGTVGIAHTRWATHGAKTDANSHPHICYQNKFALVHNGIIENYTIIKDELLKKNIPFKSQTDTEVIVNLISMLYTTTQNVELSIRHAISQLEGTWGLVIICIDEPDRMYCARHGSPLLIGIADDFAMVASEQSGFCKYVNNYMCLKDNDIVILEKDNNKIKLYKESDYVLYNVIAQSMSNTTPHPYKHWTLKEINEQPDSIKRAMGMGGRILNDYEVKLGGLNSHQDDIKEINNLILLGCGTSYHAGLYNINLFKKLGAFNLVQIYDGASFSEYDIPTQGNTCVILLSQSGETKDLCYGLEVATEKGLLSIGVINVVDSLIAKEVVCGVYLNAGREVGVASTKSFTSQCIILQLIAMYFAQIKGINKTKRKNIIESIRTLPINITDTINKTHDQCIQVAKYLIKHTSVFILGRDNCEAIAKEGALKIKELGYIHAEGYSSTALKHGPYSLIVEGTPIIILCPNDKFYNKNKGVIEEVKSRGAYVIVISDLINIKADINIQISKNTELNSLLCVIPLQLIAYELACLKGHSPDFPRNLAKCVTTD